MPGREIPDRLIMEVPLGSSLSPRLNPPFRTVPTMAIKTADGGWAPNPPGFSGPNIVGQIETKDRSAPSAKFSGEFIWGTDTALVA